MKVLLSVTASVVGVEHSFRLVRGALVLLGGWLVGLALPGGLADAAAEVADAAAEVQELVNSLGALSGVL